MITSLYAGILAVWICYLSVQVIKQRRKHRVSHADGQVDDLAVARGAHSNATEYIPIGLLLLMLAEFNGAPEWAIHILGTLLVVGRLSHGLAVLNRKMKGRVFGMMSTFGVIGLLAALNVVQAIL
ncbi:MAPEG family protein [Vibrio breoganii]|uniref:MAPEG family protein n=1 Tax=Vibrio breoganii TaxID=553239 RepID=UPI0021C3960C|nr:MAPEG family protein [Vibrio breoganii]MDN3715915.1 MAPEG family protein [Vibrio breoganii]